MTTSRPFPVPKVTDLDIAFPARAMKFMPAMEDIPPRFKQESGDFHRFFRHVFYDGPQVKNLEMTPREGIDARDAFRALRVIAGSFEPKHEHKEAAFAYLAHEWFDLIAWDKGQLKYTAAAERNES